MKHSHRWLRDVAVVTVTNDGGAEALQESTLADELVESTTIEELDSTVRTESDGVVAGKIIRDSMVKLWRILVRVKTNWARMKKIPGHAVHEKGLQRQIGVGTLVSSQKERALLVPVINRLSTAGQPRVLFLHRLT